MPIDCVTALILDDDIWIINMTQLKQMKTADIMLKQIRDLRTMREKVPPSEDVCHQDQSDNWAMGIY